MRNCSIYFARSTLAVVVLTCFMLLLLPNKSARLVPVHLTDGPSSSIISEQSGFVRNSTAVPQVCFISRTYQKQYHYLLTHLLSISHNPVAKPIVLLTITDETSGSEPVINVIRTANALIGYEMAHLLPITKHHAQNISSDYKNDFGYSYTDAAIEYLLQNSKAYPCDYLVFTNGDNLYYANYLDDYILPDISEGIQAIGTNFVSRYDDLSPHVDEGNVRDDRSRRMREVELKIGMIDLGAFLISTSVLIADLDMRFIRQHVLHPNTGAVACSDGKLIEYVASKGLKTRIHRQTFLIHQ